MHYSLPQAKKKKNEKIAGLCLWILVSKKLFIIISFQQNLKDNSHLISTQRKNNFNAVFLFLSKAETPELILIEQGNIPNRFPMFTWRHQPHRMHISQIHINPIAIVLKKMKWIWRIHIIYIYLYIIYLCASLLSTTHICISFIFAIFAFVFVFVSVLRFQYYRFVIEPLNEIRKSYIKASKSSPVPQMPSKPRALSHRLLCIMYRIYGMDGNEFWEVPSILDTLFISWSNRKRMNFEERRM